MSTLRFLLLEDKPQDAEEIQAKLTDGGIAYELLRVDTRADFVTALETQAFDLILAAYAMPSLDGIAALDLACTLCPDVPFIFVSASLGEELAIETLKRGATDYVLKQRLERLVPCVQRALREVQGRKRSEAALRQAEAKNRMLFESIDEGFCLCEMLFDENGEPHDYRFLEVNPLFEAMTGLERATGKTARELVPTLEAYWFETYGSVVLTGKPFRFEQQSVPMNRWFNVNVFRIGEPQSNQFAVLFTNISDRKKAEQERDRFLAIGSDLQVITGGNGYFQWVSPTFERVLGWTVDEMTSRPWTDFVHPDDIGESVSEADRLFSGNETLEFENRYRHKDGSYRWFLWRAQPYPEEQVLYGTAIDITEAKRAEIVRKRSEAALRQSEARLRLIIESAKEYAIFSLDLNGIITSWNAGAERLLDYREAEIVGCHSRIIFTPEDIERGKPEQELQIALTQGRAINERWHVRKDGSRYWGSGLMMPLQTETDSPQGFIKIMQDKTAQRQADERFRLLYDTTSDLLATEQPMTLVHNLFSKLSAQLELHYYYNYMVEEKDNQLMLHLMNYEGISDEVAQAIAWLEFGQHLCGQVAQERQQIVLDHAQILTHSKAQLARSIGITAYVGQPLIVRGRLLGTLSFASRTRTGFTPEESDLLQSTCDQIAIAIERANLMQSIQQQAEQLQQANQIKDEFLAVLSHELRSPLNPILGWSKLLQQGRLDEARTKNALATIERNAQLQSQLIEDLLDISRILRGKLSLNVMPIDLSVVISAALETVHLAAEAKLLHIQTTLSPHVGMVMGDAGRLQQVVWNLLSNAVKFTPQGGQITVTLSQTKTHAQLQVTDTGKGIQPDFLPYVFDCFRQEDGATTRKFGGLGLGLAIVQQIVELHGGTVAVDSLGEGLGATFTVQIPLAARSRELPAPEPSFDLTKDLSNIHVLVVDDEADSREFVVFVLEQANAIVTSVSSGIEALQFIEQAIPDLVVSDIGMPDMDGYMLMQQVRSLDSLEPARQVPAIALTAYAGEFDRQQAIASGFQQHIPKPVDPDKLLSTISALFPGSRRSGDSRRMN